MAEFFGDLERLAADLYPYRWPLFAAIVVVLAGAAFLTYRKGWHMLLKAFVLRNRVAVTVIGVPLLIIFGFITYDLGSPLFINKTVEEEFPFAFAAEVPTGMSMEDVEMIMSGMAEIDSEVEEAMPAMMGMGTEEQSAGSQAVALKSGNFRDADSFHRGSGTATVYRAPDGSHLLRLEDFSVTNGPDLRVLLSRHPDPMDRHQVRGDDGDEFIELDKLKGNRGNQNYPISADVDPAEYNSVIIYCWPFSVVFSVAPLTEVSGG